MARKESGPDSVLCLYKRKSETPLQTAERYAKAHPEYAKSRMTYAGRLDPMAEGVLVVLTGEKNKEREAYTGLDKEYEFEFILGVETDTFDVLGKIVAEKGGGANAADVEEALKKYEGTILQAYPAYSSKVLNGVQLFELARQGKLDGVELPKHEVTASKIELLGTRIASKDELWAAFQKDISAVTGDFRQEETLALWEAWFSKAPKGLSVYKARIACGSGFYVRQLVSDIGRDLGTGAVTISILRTRVGEFLLKDAVVS